MIEMTKTCTQCGAIYSRGTGRKRTNAEQWTKSRFCSLRCCGAALRQRAVVDDLRLREIFDSLIEKTEGCWLWRGTTDDRGYGLLGANGKNYRASHLALQFDGRPVPKGMMGCHHCDNPPCVRPGHLYVGTAQNNVDDRERRGRALTGELRPNAKLTSQYVRRMRELRQQGARYVNLSYAFRVSLSVTWEAANGKTWAHTV
jgi:hypothetical protein